MSIEIGPIEPQLEAAVRRHVEGLSPWRTLSEAAQWHVQGARLPFYRQGWLCLISRLQGEESAFVIVRTNTKSRVRIVMLTTIQNAPGEVDRINKKFRLDLSRDNVLAYLAFYYAFTPKQDVVSRNLKRPPSQFHFPLTVASIGRAPGVQESGEPGRPAIGCLMTGAIWRYIDRKNAARIVATRQRGNKLFRRFSGNALIQFRDGLFSADFNVTSRSGAPTLSDVELILKDKRLRAPAEIRSQDLPRLNNVRNITEDLLEAARRTREVILRFTAAGTWRGLTVVAVALWLISAGFPLAEIFGWSRPKSILDWVGRLFGLGNWADALFLMTSLGIALWLGMIVYFTQMEKLFNVVFRLCPRRARAWLAGWLDARAQERDRLLTARDTLLKRSRFTVALFGLWAGYLIMAFASLQLAIGHLTLLPDVAKDLPAAPPLTTLWSLVVQAVVNVPIFFILLYRFGAELFPHESLHPKLVTLFHVVIAAVVVKGIYRIWAISAEASPRNFIRRLMARNDSA